MARRKVNTTANVNNKANTGKPAGKTKKVGPLGKFRNKHPKLTKAASTTGKIVVAGLAAVGGTGLALAINERRPAKTIAPAIPDLPDIPVVEPAPIVDETPAEE